MKQAARTILKILLPLLALGIGVGIFVGLLRTKPKADRAEPSFGAPLVEVITVSEHTVDAVVRVQGEVVPAQRIVLQPEVGGRVVWQSPDLVPGGFFRAGQAMLRVDPRDYSVAVEQQGAQLNRAQLDVEVEQGRSVVAQREWELLGSQETGSEEGRALALREPQLRTARVAMRAAESAVKRARLELRRTTLNAPFDAVVLSEVVDPGQLVGPQSQLAVLAASDRSWVQVSIPVEQLGAIAIPGQAGASDGSAARVWQQAGADRIERDGRVIRLLGDLDPVGRMARLLVEINDPYGVAAPNELPGLPLLIGAYVNVEIRGHRLEGVVEVPRSALREASRVYVANDQDRLEIRDITVAWRNEDSVLVSSGVRAGERIITSRVPLPVEGMELRISAAPRAPRPDRRAEAP